MKSMYRRVMTVMICLIALCMLLLGTGFAGVPREPVAEVIRRVNGAKEKGAFVETTFYNGNYYGCSKKEIAKDKVVVVDPIGLSSFLALNDPSIISIFLVCDEKVRFKRMQGRGDEEDNIIQRIATDQVDFANPILEKADFTIDTSNDDVETLTNRIYSIYQKEYEKRIKA